MTDEFTLKFQRKPNTLIERLFFWRKYYSEHRYKLFAPDTVLSKVKESKDFDAKTMACIEENGYPW